MGNTSLVDAGYREMTELTFLRCGAKYQNVWKAFLVLNLGVTRKKAQGFPCFWLSARHEYWYNL